VPFHHEIDPFALKGEQVAFSPQDKQVKLIGPVFVTRKKALAANDFSCQLRIGVVQ
jgi:hypothetical protein